MASVKFKKSKGKVSTLGTVMFFAVLGALCIIIGFHDSLIPWFKKYWLTIAVCVSPVIIFIIFQFSKKKIDSM